MTFRVLTNTILAASLLALLSACARPFLIQEQREAYALKYKHGLMITNWETSKIDRKSRQLQTGHGQVDLRYPFIAQNVNQKGDISLNLKKATFHILDTSTAAHCDVLPNKAGKKSISPPDVTKLDAGHQVHILCRMHLSTQKNPLLATHDVFGKLEIPFTVEAYRAPQTITLSYKLKIEDFQDQ